MLLAALLPALVIPILVVPFGYYFLMYDLTESSDLFLFKILHTFAKLVRHIFSVPTVGYTMEQLMRPIAVIGSLFLAYCAFLFRCTWPELKRIRHTHAIARGLPSQPAILELSRQLLDDELANKELVAELLRYGSNDSTAPLLEYVAKISDWSDVGGAGEAVRSLAAIGDTTSLGELRKHWEDRSDLRARLGDRPDKFKYQWRKYVGELRSAIDVLEQKQGEAQGQRS
jgi:hypothetical protein